MDRVQVECPECKARGSIDATFVGRKISCPQCRNVFVLGCHEESLLPPVSTPAACGVERALATHEECGTDRCAGLIGFFGLQEWWLSTFSPTEREYMTRRYNPMGFAPRSLTDGELPYCTLRLDVFLSTLAGWFAGEPDAFIRQRILAELATLTSVKSHDEPGEYQGRHYTTYVADIKDDKRAGELDKAEKDLLGIIKTMERKAAKPERIKSLLSGKVEYYTESVAPW